MSSIHITTFVAGIENDDSFQIILNYTCIVLHLGTRLRSVLFSIALELTLSLRLQAGIFWWNVDKKTDKRKSLLTFFYPFC